MPALACVALLAGAAAPQEAKPSEDPPPEIIVTGERVPRPVLETPSSVAVVTESEIEASGADRVEQMLALIPNVQLGNGSQGPAIRGMDTTGPLFALPAFLGGNRPRTTIIVDGRPVTYNEFVVGAFGVWDIDRIEVFRSPQTTTQGQNSIAGAIFVNSNDPSFEPEYRVRAIGGDFRTRQISALATGPLAGDEVAFRIAGDLRYSRTTSRIEDVMRGADPNHDFHGVLRAKLLAEPADGTRVTLTYAHSRSQAPQVVGIDAPFRRRRDDTAGYGIFRINVDSITAAIRHEPARDLDATVLLTAGDSKSRRFAIPHFGETLNEGRDWSAEAVLNWSPEGPLRIVGGASHTHLRQKQFIDLALLSGAIGRFRDRQEGTGVFADAELGLSSRATLTAGIRYQRDRQRRKGAMTANTFEIPVDFVGEFDSWLPKVTLSYDLGPGLRIGAMVQKAYNPGGTTIRVDTARPDDFRPETLWDYELFVRAELAGGRATATANLFYYDMRDAQRFESILVFTPSGRPAGFANQFNVPRARSFGAEGQLTWRAGERLSLRLAAGLLDTKILETDSESDHLGGNEFDRSPHFTGAAAIDWRPTDRLRLSAQVRHHSAYFSDPENSPELRIDSGTNVDARVEYRIGRHLLSAQVRNVFDSLNLLSLGTTRDGVAEDPRRFAVGLETRF